MKFEQVLPNVFSKVVFSLYKNITVFNQIILKKVDVYIWYWNDENASDDSNLIRSSCFPAIYFYE